MKKQERETDIFSDEEYEKVEKLYQAITNIDSDLIERAQKTGIERVQYEAIEWTQNTRTERAQDTAIEQTHGTTLERTHDITHEREQETTNEQVQETTAENIPHRMKLHKKIFTRLSEMIKQAKHALSEAIEDVEIEGRTVVTALVCVCVIFIAGAFVSSYFGGTSGSSLNEGEETTETDRESEEITDGSDESEEITEESGEEEGITSLESSIADKIR